MAETAAGGRQFKRSGREALWSLLVLSLLWALETAQPDLMPDRIPWLGSSSATPLVESALFMLLALLAALLAGVRRTGWPRGRQILNAAILGLTLFLIPALLIRAAGAEVSSYTRVVLFSLAPVFAVALEPYIDPEAGSPIHMGLFISLAGVVGAALIFPVAIPESTRGVFGFTLIILAAVCIAAGNCWGCRLTRESRDPSPLIAIAGAAAALGFAAASLWQEVPKDTAASTVQSVAQDAIWIVVVKLPALCLLCSLLPRMRATSMIARYLLAPALAVLIGAVVLRAIDSVGPRIWLGLAGMSGAAAGLLLARPEAADSTPYIFPNGDE